MSNRLRMANIHAIIGLLEQKWSYRRISRELGVDRDTVSRYDRLRQSRAKPAIVTADSEMSGDQHRHSDRRAMPTPGDLVFAETSGRLPGRASQCDPFTDVIEKKLDNGLSAQRIWQDLVSEKVLLVPMLP